MSMIIDNSSNGKDFKPDAKLDTEREYEGRIVGLAHIGVVQNQDFDDKEKINEIEQAIILIEFTEEDTYVPRGAEGEEVMKPRIMPKFIKYSSHEKSGLFALAKAANPKAAWVEGQKGFVNPALILGEPLSITLKDGKEDKQNISKINPIPAKYKAGVDAMVSPKFLYDIDSGAHAGTAISDVPTWILNYAINKAVNVEEFGQLEVIEAHLKAVEGGRDSGKLEGDDKPKAKKKAAKTEEKKAAKAEEKKPDPVEPEEKKEAPAEEAKTSRRGRRSAKTEEPSKPDFSEMGEEALEDYILSNGKTEADLDEVSDAAADDDAYVVGLRELAATL